MKEPTCDEILTLARRVWKGDAEDPLAFDDNMDFDVLQIARYVPEWTPLLQLTLRHPRAKLGLVALLRALVGTDELAACEERLALTSQVLDQIKLWADNPEDLDDLHDLLALVGR